MLTAAGIFYLSRNDSAQTTGHAETFAEIPKAPEFRTPLEPSNLIRKVEEAEALEKTGDFRGSETAFAEIIKTNPENDRAWGGLGRSILAAGRYQEASDALDNACRLQVIDGRNFAARGAARRAMNKLKAAYQDFNDAQRLNPRDIQSSLAMLFVAIELEDYGLFDRTMVKLRSTARASQPEWMLAEAAKELHIGENHNAQLLLEKASEGLPPEQYEALLSDRIFADKRSKALIATLGQVVSP